MQNYQEQSLSPIRSLLSRLFDGWSVGAGKAPTIYGDNALPPDVVNDGRTRMADTMLAAQNRAAAPMPMAPTDAEADALEAQRNGPMNDANLPPSIRNMRRRAPAYDEAAMNYLTSPVVEGQNANIDDDARARALAWAMRMNPNG